MTMTAEHATDQLSVPLAEHQTMTTDEKNNEGNVQRGNTVYILVQAAAAAAVAADDTRVGC